MVKEKDKLIEDQHKEFEEQKKNLEAQLLAKNKEYEEQMEAKHANFDDQKEKVAALEAKILEIEIKRSKCIISWLHQK